jgi:putative ABC transport system substrate-binding protein
MKITPGSDKVVFCCLLIAAASLSLPARPEDPATLPHVGILTPPIPSIFETPLTGSLRELGYVDGNTVRLDVRRFEGSQQGWRRLADDLVRSKADLIIAIGTPAARAALDATTTIPVVFGVGEAVSTGLVTSLAKPRANGTGITNMSTEVSAKRLELLLELAPDAHRVVYLYNPASPIGPRLREEVQQAAALLRVQVEAMEAKDAGEIQRALDKISRIPPDGFLVSSELLFLANRDRIIQAVAKARLPTVFPWRVYAVDGGLTSYGVSNEEGMRRVAAYADRILKGTKPSDLPVEQLAKFHLVVNLKTAKAQGITIPESFRLRTDEVIR